MNAGQDAIEATDIAVIGYHGRFPGAPSVDALWEVLLGDRSARRTPDRAALEAAGIPRSLLDEPSYVPAVYGLDDSDCFHAQFFLIFMCALSTFTME